MSGAHCWQLMAAAGAVATLVSIDICDTHEELSSSSLRLAMCVQVSFTGTTWHAAWQQRRGGVALPVKPFPS